MDFAFREEQEQLRNLARQILEAHTTRERLREVEASPERFDRDLWKELGRAHLLGVALPEDVGGSGFGIVELCLLLEEVGRAVAPVPVLATLVLGALPVDRFGSAEQRRRILAPVAAGEAVLSAALDERQVEDPTAASVAARRDGGAWRLDGVAGAVPAAHLAARVLVPAATGDGVVGVFLVDPRGGGAEVARQESTSGEPLARLALSGAAVAPEDVLGDPRAGAEVVRWTVERALVGLCAIQVGLAERALRMTADYTAGRVQFGRPLGTFQAVQQRLADAYIDVEAMRWTTWRAAWRLAEGLSTEEEVAVAKFWAADGGQRVLAAAQHLHGGVGVDVDYPLHRYTLWSKQVELALGGASRHLWRLGALIAGRPGE